MLKEKLLFVLIFLLYCVSPLQYNYGLCCIGLCLFTAFFYFTLKASHYAIASFNVLFSLTFFGVTYLYPIFVYPIFPTFSSFSVGTVNENIITRATFLATLAYSAYAYFYIYAYRKYPAYTNKVKTKIIEKKISSGVLTSLVALYLLFIVVGGLNIFKADYSGQSISVNSAAKYVYVFFISYIIFACIANRNINNKLLYVIIIAVAVSIGIMGSRTLPIRILSVLFVLFVDKHRVSKKAILLLIILGFVLMSWIGRNRSSVSLEKGELGAVASAVDLIVCSRAYYEIYDYVNMNGITYGLTSTAIILSVIPYTQYVFSNVFGVSGQKMRSDTFVSELVLGNGNSSLGLGTHIVGDTYLSFGLIGTLILFSFLGFFVVKWRYNTYHIGNWKSTVMYFTMISCAIFMNRSSYFLGLKDIVWILCITYFFRSVSINKVRVNKYNN